MKNKIIFGSTTMVIAFLAAWNIHIQSFENGLSDVSLVNVEALSATEGVSTKPYQTMAYCSAWFLKQKCTYEYTATSCTSDCD